MLDFVYKRESEEDNENLSCIPLIFSGNSNFFSIGLFIDCDQKTQNKAKKQAQKITLLLRLSG